MATEDRATTPNKLKIVVIAEESAGVAVLKSIAEGPHTLIAVMASESPAGYAPVWNFAKQKQLPLWPAEEVEKAELADKIENARTDVIVNVHSLHIVHEQVLNAVTLGAFNLHPGPLPEYAGLNAPSWAIYHGRKEHAVTVHKMEPGIDTGAIVLETRFAVTEDDTGLSVSMRCVERGVPLVLRTLQLLSRDPRNLPLREQDLTKRKYFGKEPPQRGRVDWTKNARAVHDFVRASDYSPFRSPWGYPATKYRSHVTRLSRTVLTGVTCDARPGTIGTDDDGNIRVACADDWLGLRRVLIDGAGTSPAEYLIPGTRFDDPA